MPQSAQTWRHHSSNKAWCCMRITKAAWPMVTSSPRLGLILAKQTVTAIHHTSILVGLLLGYLSRTITGNTKTCSVFEQVSLKRDQQILLGLPFLGAQTNCPTPLDFFGSKWVRNKQNWVSEGVKKKQNLFFWRNKWNLKPPINSNL